MEENFEKKHSIERVVGTSKEEEREIKKIAAQIFEEQDIKELKKIELKKTPKQIEIINLVNEETNELLAKYNLPKFDIPHKNVHLLDKDIYKRTYKRKEEEKPDTGHFKPSDQAIFVSKFDSKLGITKLIYHEFIHFKSYQASRINYEGDIKSYRFGMGVYSPDGRICYFNNLNEAVTEELCKRFYLQKLKNNPFFKDEIEKIEEVRKIFLSVAKTDKEKEEAMDISMLEPEKKKGLKKILSFKKVEGIFTFSHQKERETFNKLVDKLYQRNQKDFKNREEIFELFAKSMLGGNLLPVGKLVDRTFDKGTFRKIGELDNDIDKQSEFIKKL
jgi:hypothetical protein